MPSRAFRASFCACLGVPLLLSAFALAELSECLPFRLGRPFGVVSGLPGEVSVELLVPLSSCPFITGESAAAYSDMLLSMGYSLRTIFQSRADFNVQGDVAMSVPVAVASRFLAIDLAF